MSLLRCIGKLNFFILKIFGTRQIIFLLFFWIFIAFFVIFYVIIQWNNDPYAINQPFIYIEPINGYFRYKKSSEKKDWHDYQAIEREAKRRGPGEQGQAVIIPPEEQELASQVFEENKHNGVASDKIARDRSLPDTRPEGCKAKKYLKELPKVSVIIPFHNEVLSTLTRTIHSVVNRSPPELLKEVILVNDHSDKEHCYGELEEYIEEHFERGKIKTLLMSKRFGLMAARLAGARAASGEILVFLDCHTEANVNWLPPLIEPIAENYRTVTCPYIDVISAQNYQYHGIGSGARGVFNWQFYYQFLPVRPQDQSDPTEPFPSPVMMGCVFAISAKFFWELGGYDPGFEIWGGEQYELSFKAWLCHGRQLDTPCSRVGHLYRPRPFLENLNNTDYAHKNYKRVAEVWMDDYAKYVYKRDPDEWNRLDVGDLSYMRGIKEKLKCKPFSYFLNVVAPDMLDRWPPDEVEFASGAIQSVIMPSHCLDTLGASHSEPIGLYPCKSPYNLSNPVYRQSFTLRQHRDISIELTDNDCLDANHGRVLVYPCMWTQRNQYFRYDLDTMQIICGSMRQKNCMEVVENDRSLIVSQCDEKKKAQKFRWGYVNETMLRNWGAFGKEILDVQEIEDLRVEKERRNQEKRNKKKKRRRE